jgi:hypothetical protein
VHFDIPPPRTATYGPAGALNALPEYGHHVIPHAMTPFLAKGSTQSSDAVAIKLFDIGFDLKFG